MLNPPPLPANHSPAAAEAAVLLDRYVLETELGRGHLATVYRATDTVLDRAVAVKVLHPHLCRDPRFVEQFLDMERRMARLFHPNLVTIYDAAADDQQCFVVMEYVAGGSLQAVVEGSAPLPTPDALQIASQVTEALQVLHDQGIVHGEIKPDNVLLDQVGNAKLVDFGIAHLATTTGAIRSDSLARSAPYLAPEQLEHGQADARSDIYALGLLTYELLAGRQPFEGATWIMVATRRLEADPHPLGQLRPDLPIGLVAAVMRSLERDPARRFGSAEEFRAALAGPWDPETVDEAGPTQPIGDRSSSVADRARRYISRAPRTPLPTHANRADPAEPSAPAPPPEWQPARQAASIPTPDSPGRSRDAVLPAPAAVDRAEIMTWPEPAPRATALPPAAPRRSRRPDPFTTTLLGGTALVALALLALLALMLALSALGGRGDRAAVRTPDLRGRPLETARQDLAAVGLQLGTIQERETGDHPRGTVVDQSIRPDAGVAAGRAVDVTVAVPPRASVPSLVDRPLADAQAELERRGLRLGGVQTQPAADKQAGTVIAQEPGPNTQLRRGDTVAVTIAVPPVR